jgi:DNA helicase HerA-like ATPase
LTDITNIATVVGVAPDLIQIEIDAGEGYASLDPRLEIGSYLKISDDDGKTVIVIVQSYRIKDSMQGAPEQEVSTPRFLLDTQPVGRLEDGRFKRGGKQITIPPTHVEIASSEVLAEIYGKGDPEMQFTFSSLAQDDEVDVLVDGDKFFGKHIGVVGSTGSGKSCSVARILQRGIQRSEDQAERSVLNNSHIVMFDLHGEYAPAFPDARVIGIETLRLPYWLMNSEELEEMFIESQEQNSHNQVSQFRQAVIENKERHAGTGAAAVSYDSPIYFSLEEVINYLTNLNKEVVGRLEGEGLPKLKDNTLVQQRSDHYFEEQEFVEPSQSKADRAGAGPFNGEFNRFLMRLESRRADSRLDFLLAPGKDDQSEFKTADLGELMERITGYGQERTNVTILDLSGIPFEVLSIVVSLVSRLIFSFAFHLRRKRETNGRELPFLVVYEEAHNYVPQRQGAKYGSVTRSIERIAKEGRKYGVSLMVVSQRPAEISESIFSQCNNFVAMRLTNPTDQQYVKRLLPDNLAAITQALPTLERREAIVIGDAVNVPSLVTIDEITDVPKSQDVKVHTEWQKDWLDIDMQDGLPA